MPRGRWIGLEFLGALLFLLTVGSLAAQIEWPAITSQTKPWTRWWWLGGIDSTKDISVEMEKYAAAGLGGLEITPIYGVKGRESQYRNYLTPQWIGLVEHSLREGKRLNLGMDMATGNGWPFGGPWVSSEDACRNLVYRTYTLRGGQTLTEPVTHVQAPMVRTIGTRVRIADLKEPIGANPNLQQIAPEQIRFEKPLPLESLMAYSDGGQAIDLTARVQNQKLNWTAPAGNWTLYALFMGWHGKMVERAGPGGEGDVIDHFSATALRHYLQHFDQALKGRDVSSLRAYFNDSYEVDDATGQSDWTPQLFDEFRKRRGYDLRLHLPALFGKDTAEKNARVRCDYRETISDLLLERFTRGWGEWARSKGALTRNQAHGSPANVLDLYAASGIPETEGSDVLRIKFASSAAHVTGKPLAASESATWLEEHFLGSLGGVKQAVDLFFLGGVNHIVYHGTAFSPPGEAWPGWQFYAAVELSPTNPIWRDFPVLNRYVARVQSFLQAGKPDSDVLLYYPIHDAWSVPGNEMLLHFSGPNPGSSVRADGEQLLALGYSFDYVSDRQLAGVKLTGKTMQTGGVSYQAIVVPSTRNMPVATARKLAELAQGGATVVMHGSLPTDVPGWGQLDQRRKALQQSVAVLKEKARLGENLRHLLADAGIGREVMVDQQLQFVRRRLAEGAAYFVINRGTSPMDGWVPLGAAHRAVGIFDPMQGVIGLGALRTSNVGTHEVYLELEPGESAIVRTFDNDVKGPATVYWETIGAAREIAGAWRVEFIEGGPQLPPAGATLGSWTTYGGDAVKAFSGTARYAITFARPAGPGEGWLLDLGRVAESARVRLNGKEVGALIEAPFRLRVPSALLADSNTLEVEVTNLAANRIADMDRRGVEYRNFYNVNFPSRRPENRGPDGLFSAAKWAPRESGLIGPVTLTPMRPVRFH